MPRTLLKSLLISALAASMLVGCTGLPTMQPQTPAVEGEQPAITSATVKEFLTEVKQTLASLRTVNGATAAVASAAAGYRLSSMNPWDWERQTLGDGTVEMTRHVVEMDASGATVTDIQSTRREKTTDGVMTYSQEDVVTKSPTMAPGTYAIAGTSTLSGTQGQADFKAVSEQTTTYTPAGGTARKVTMAATYTPAQSVLTVTGTLPDGATIAYESTQSGVYNGGAPSEIRTTIDLTITSPSGKTITVQNALDNVFTSTESSSSTDSKGFYQVALGNVMKVRFDIDILMAGTFVAGENGGGHYEYSYPRNNLTAELLDGAGKRIAPIGLETTTDHSKPPTKGTLALEGEAPSELDMSFMMDIQRVQMSLPYMVY